MTSPAGADPAGDLGAVFRRSWASEGYSLSDLPDSWQAQVEVWVDEGVSGPALRAFFDAWSAKPRLDAPQALYRYLQVCCFSRTRPESTRSRHRATAPADPRPSGEVWSEPSWVGRDPGNAAG